MSAPLVFVTVGTDHHRFDRLMDWVEQWCAARSGAGYEVRCVVQHGPARAPSGAECHQLLPHPAMQELFHAATAVVCQGGPGSIMESRAAGRLPIVVPRVARLNEVVDDHQVWFAERVAKLEKIALASTAEELFAHLDAALADPRRYTVPPDADDAARTAARIGELVDELVTSGSRRRFRRQRASAG